MSTLSKTFIAATVMAASGIAAAAKPLPVANYMGIENREGLVAIPVCAKADLEAGTRFVWTEDLALRSALEAGAKLGCFERLGREGDIGYSQAGVTLIREGGNVYRTAVNGKPAGQALRAMATPKEVVKRPELSERTGIVGYVGYSVSGEMTLHAVEYSDGTRDVIRRNGATETIPAGTLVTVAREQVGADHYWLSIAKMGQ